MLFLADYSGVSSAAVVNANVTPTTTTTPTTMGAIQMGEAADETTVESRKLRLRYISTYSTNLLPFAETHVGC